MATLPSLPSELLLHIYICSPDLQTAARLSGTNRRIRSIWLEHSDPIVRGVFGIPAYQDAVDLAIAEETWTESAQPHSSTNSLFPNLFLGRLVHNAGLASMAAATWAAGRAHPNALIYRLEPNYTDPHPSYYLMRKIVLAYQHPQTQLRSALYSMLCASPLDALETHRDICAFLTSSESDEEDRLPHGIPKAPELWTEDEEWAVKMNGLAITINNIEWDYTFHVLDAAVQDRTDDGQRLKTCLFGSIRDPDAFPR